MSILGSVAGTTVVDMGCQGDAVDQNRAQPLDMPGYGHDVGWQTSSMPTCSAEPTSVETGAEAWNRSRNTCAQRSARGIFNTSFTLSAHREERGRWSREVRMTRPLPSNVLMNHNVASNLKLNHRSSDEPVRASARRRLRVLPPIVKASELHFSDLAR
jgi:hypothetical protein